MHLLNMLGHGGLLNKLDHFPEREEGLGLAGRLDDGNRCLLWLAERSLGGEDGPRVLGDEFLVDNGLGLDELGLLRLVANRRRGESNLGLEVLLLLDKVLVKVRERGAIRSEGALVGAGGGRGESLLIVVVVDNGVLFARVLEDLLLGAGRRSSNSSLGRHGEVGAGHDAAAKLRDADTEFGVGVEDAAKNVVEIIRKREDGLEEAGRADVGAVGRVLERSLLPWVTATGEVDEDDTETPDVVGSAHVVGLAGRRVEALGAHVKGRAAAIVLRAVLGSSQAKVGKLDGLALVSHQDVLGLEIAVVDAELVAVLNGVEDLEEDLLGHEVVANVLATLGDVEEQVTLGAVLHDDVHAVDILDDLVHGDDVGVGRGSVVKADLTLLVSNLAALKGSAVGVELAKALDGIADACLDINSRVDDAVGTGAKDICELESTFKEAA